MTRSRARGSRVALGLAGVLVAGCAGCSLSGLDDRYGQVDASADAMGASEGGDGSSSGEAGADACQPTENCLNGIDDNCDGKTDCADPQCTTAGYACTAAAIPAGWALVAYSAATRPVCPTAYATEQAVISGVDGGVASCGCTCSGSSATCQGTASYSGYPNSCATGATSVNLGVNDGACRTTSTGITSGDSYQLYFASTAAPQQGACTGTGMVQSAPTPTFSGGATCAAPAMLGTGCAAGTCAPPTGAAFQACIAHPGAVACPAFGFTQKTLVSTGSPGWVDMRTCGACPCATSLACGTVSNVALFTNGTCAGGASYNINTGCQLVNSNASIGSYEVSFPRSGSATCQATGSSAPGGSVTLDSHVETICCAH